MFIQRTSGKPTMLVHAPQGKDKPSPIDIKSRSWMGVGTRFIASHGRWGHTPGKDKPSPIGIKSRLRMGVGTRFIASHGRWGHTPDYEVPCQARSSIVGAIPCGRTASFTSILIYCLSCLMLLASCTGPTTTTTPAPTRTGSLPSSTLTTTPTSTPTPKAGTTPQHFRSHVILRGVGRPDDLVFDRQGNILFSDFYNGTISRVNKDGTATVLLSGVAGPEGLIVLPDGTMIIAEQRTNRILSLAPGAQSPTLLRVLPGTPSTASCKDGVDGIALDPGTNTIVVPDSPTGDVYSLSLDGKTLTRLASGIVRPVGAAVDTHGNIYVADECGGALWHISPTGATARIGGFGMLDDVAIDPHGNILVTDLDPSIHALIRMNPVTGKRETLASQGFIEPQGLIVDKNDNIYVSDDYADIIVEYQPA